MRTTNHLERRLRHAVRLDASVTRSEKESCATVVTDLSLDGCCISGFFTIGEQVEIRVRPIGTLHGQIRWSFAGRAGVRFAKRNESTIPATPLYPDARGVAAIEYALIAAFVALAIVASLTGLCQQVEATWTNVDQAMPGDGGVGFNAA